MDDGQLLRYSRHILLPEIGIEGQERIRAASVLIVGAGGLGCPAALYLAASGVGRITLADPDEVDLTNLQRQILYRTADVGLSKTVAAHAALMRINPEVSVITMPARLEGGALQHAVSAHDVVLDCSDNFATRHAVNRCCVMQRRPLVSGAAIRFDGQLAVFDARNADSPCYACLYAEDSDPEEANCALMGIVAPLAGVVGSLQALETLKLIAQAGTVKTGQLLLIDALQGDMRTVRIPRDPDCSVCGPRPD